jgi:hypothetical protein
VPDREPIERNGTTLEQAVRNAFNELAFHGELGRGRLVVRMPDTFSGEPRTLSLATGDASTAIVRRRLADLATTLLIMSIVVPGVGEVSAVIAAGLAVERLARRAVNGTLRLDAEAVSDTLAILGAVAQGAQLVGRLRVVRAGDSFIAALREGDQAAIQAAAEALDSARRAGKILDATNTVVNVGGLLWGDAVALRELAQIEQDELDGVISHADARRKRAGILGAAIRDHGIMLHGMLRPQGADRASGREDAPPERVAPDARPRDNETIAEPELERRARDAAAAQLDTTPAEPARDGVRARFRTPDRLHEIFILNDGRIFRCSLTCAQLRTWYDPYLKGQTDAARQHEATQLHDELTALEQRTGAGENTPALEQAIGALDVKMREFIAPDLSTELAGVFQGRTGPDGRPLLAAGQRLLTVDQARNLLRFFGVDEIQAMAGNDGFRSADGLRRLANRPDATLLAFREALRAYPGDALAMRGLTETMDATGYAEAALVTAYNRAVQLKNQYGTRISGEIVERCVRAAAGGVDAAQAEVEVQTGIRLLEAQTPLGAGLEIQGLLELGGKKQPEYAVTTPEGRRLVEAKRVTGTAGEALTPTTLGNNLRKALSQIRAETRPDDAGGLVTLDARPATPTDLDVAAVEAMVMTKLRDGIKPDSTGAPRGTNVEFIEILYRDASGADAMIVLRVSYTTTTDGSGATRVTPNVTRVVPAPPVPTP